MNVCFPAAPGQAGGAPPAGERAARQSLRAAGRVGPRAGAEQPPAASGQTDGAAEAPEVRGQLGLNLLQTLQLTPTFSPQPGGNGGAAAGAAGGAAAAAGGAEAESSSFPGRRSPRSPERVLPAGAPELAQVRRTRGSSPAPAHETRQCF